MDFAVILKGGFMGFALSLGMQMICFYMAGFTGISKDNFVSVFIAAGIASFASVFGLLMHQTRASATPDLTVFVAGCVGGWLAGILFGLTSGKPLLLKLWR